MRPQRRLQCPSEDMKGLLEEASKMLKSNGNGSSDSTLSSSDESGDARIRSLQQPLNDLKGASFKVLRLGSSIQVPLIGYVPKRLVSQLVTTVRFMWLWQGTRRW